MDLESNESSSGQESGDLEESLDQQEGLEDLDIDSDEELQEALASGLLKPGLNRVTEAKKKDFANDVDGLKQKLLEFSNRKLKWIERLDMCNKMAPMAPELAYKKDQIDKEKAKNTKDQKDNLVDNDFDREMCFYRQAQAAVLEAIPRLKSMGIATKRPDDYFAQMAKTDKHMQKVREKLVSKEMAEERMEKIRKLRDLKRFGKKVQIEVQQKRQKDKKEILEEVKKFRKGQISSLDFLDDDENGNISKKQMKGAAIAKRKSKDKKFGFGGKKKGMKANSKDSVNDTTSYRMPNRKKGQKNSNLGKNFKNKRVGKNRRQQQKNRKNRK